MANPYLKVVLDAVLIVRNICMRQSESLYSVVILLKRNKMCLAGLRNAKGLVLTKDGIVIQMIIDLSHYQFQNLFGAPTKIRS